VYGKSAVFFFQHFILLKSLIWLYIENVRNIACGIINNPVKYIKADKIMSEFYQPDILLGNMKKFT